MRLTLEKLREVFPDAKYGYLEAIIEAESLLNERGITASNLRISHFLAQAGAETGGFTIREENGNYSWEGLLKTFPKYFKSKSVAKAYAKRPQAIFNKTYGGRLGNNLPGDGYKYRGRGIFQITGKSGYREYGNRIGLDLVKNPDLASDPKNSIRLAISYWDDLKLNDWADKDDILAVSRGINGGNPKRNIQPNGMEHRRAWLARIKKMLFSEKERAISPALLGALREGSTGEEVKKLQSALRAKGYAAGAIDGIFGANTARAVTAFQIDHYPDAQKGIWLREYWPTLDAIENIQIERQSVTAGDLAHDPAVKAATWTQRVLLFLGFGGAITGGASEGASNFPSLVTQYQPVIETFSPLFQWLASNGWILVIIGAFLGWLFLRWAIQHIVKAYKHFDYQGPYREIK